MVRRESMMLRMWGDRRRRWERVVDMIRFSGRSGEIRL
jgi:hypothetical protein